MAETVPIEQFFASKASEGLVAEANRFKVLQKDSYNGQIVKAEGKIWKADDPEKRREVAHLTLQIIKDGKKVSTLFPNISHQTRRNSKGYLDVPARLYGQLQRALWPTASQADLDQKTVGDVIEAALKFPVGVYVGRGFEVPDEKNPKFSNVRTPRTPEEEKEYREKGYKEVNEVMSFSKYQEGK